MKFSAKLFSMLLISGAALAGIPAAHAVYPDHPVHWLVGFAPGGGTDASARIIAQKLSEKWGQPVIVENKIGADGTIAEDVAAHSPPDGYTVMWITNSHTITPAEYKLNYDPIKSFTPVTLTMSTEDLFLVHPSVPAKTMKEFIALVKAKPGQLNFASSGSGTLPYLEMALFMQLTGMNMVNVPFKGGTAPAVVALLGGEVQALMASVTTSVENVKAGKLRALAVTGIGTPKLPDVPLLIKASGLEGDKAKEMDSVVNWQGVLVPAGTPGDIVKKLHDDIADVMKTPELQDFMVKHDYILMSNTPEEASQTVVNDIKRWGDMLQSLGGAK